MKKRYILILLIALSSCSPYTNSMYFQGLERNPEINHKINNLSPITIQIGDVLGLNVKSLSPEGSAIFNTGSGSSSTSGGTTDNSSGNSSGNSGSSNGSSGYKVDQNGEIELPLIHKIKVVGMTIPEVQNAIQKAITPFLKEPIVTVQLMNFKITVMGDVMHPDVISINNDHVSIPQALTLAGDISPSGKRDNILLIREINGERKYVNIDMTSSKLLESPYYYLKNNDMLYVEEGRGKFISVSPIRQNLSIVLSLISLVLVAFEVSRTTKL
ncbi:MAG TPA: polysaccharide biosynthesis/export family protein [Mucilaginibacter sp.]